MGRIVIFLFCLIFLNPSMAAMDEEAAERLIYDFISDTRSIVNSGKPESGIWDDFNSLVEKYCDISWIAGSVGGPILRRMSRAQKVEFARAYKDRLVGKLMEYASEFNKYEIEVLRVLKSGDVYVVHSELRSNKNSNISSVEWQVSDRNGKGPPRIVNLRYEDLLLSYIESLAMRKMLDNHKGDIDSFIEEIN